MKTQTEQLFARQPQEVKALALAVIASANSGEAGAFTEAAEAWRRGGFSGRDKREDVYSAIINHAGDAERAAGFLLLDVIARNEGDEAISHALANYKDVHGRLMTLAEEFFGGLTGPTTWQVLNTPVDA